MSAWTIQERPLREQSDGLLRELYVVRGELHQEEAPGDPRPPLADEIARVRHLPAPQDGVMLVARGTDGSIAGLAECGWEQLTGWQHVLWVDLAVLPGARRRGLGRVLLEHATDVAQRRGLRLITGRTRDNVLPGAAFCRRFGAEQAIVNRENRLDLGSVDRELIDRWMADGPVRAPGYRLQFVAGRTPAGLADQVAQVLNVMNTAPRDDLDISDTLVTPELLAEYEEAHAAAGGDQWAYYAVEESSGRFVGLTGIYVERWAGDRVWVADTGVDPAHRGRGLGKWLKAAITRRILDELPGVRWVITWNARSNDAMLAINEQLGFRTSSINTTWQAATGDLQAVLAVRPGGSSAAHRPGTPTCD